MKLLYASIEDVFREAAARWTLVAYFVLSSVFILIFAFAINLDIVNGVLAGAKIFGQAVVLGSHSLDLDELVIGFETGFSAFLYIVATFLAIFATAHLVPRMQEKGTIDLYLSRPVSRISLLGSRYVAGLVLTAVNLLYLIGSIWIIIMWKTGVAHPRFLLSGAVILFAIASLLAFSFLVGVVTSSTNVSIMATYGIFFVAAIMVTHERIEAMMSSEVKAWMVKVLYWILPKTAELGRIVVETVAGTRLHSDAAVTLPLAPILSTALFALACLGLAAYLFQRKDF